MKQVYIAQDAGEAYVVKGFLESKGIAVSLQNCGPRYYTYEGPFPTVWVLEDAEAGEALSLIAQYEQGAKPHKAQGQVWHCPHCGEKIESQFTECWRCGASRTKEH